MAQAQSRPARTGDGEDLSENKELSLLFVGCIFQGGSGWLFYQRTAPFGGFPLLHDFCVALVILLLFLAVLLTVEVAIPGRKILGCSVPYIYGVISVVVCVLFVAQLSDQPPFVSFPLFSFMFVTMLLAVLAIPRLFRWRGFVINIEHSRDLGEPSPQQEREQSDRKSTPPKEPEKYSELKAKKERRKNRRKSKKIEGEEKKRSLSSAPSKKIEVTQMPKFIEPLMFPTMKLSKENYAPWKAQVTAILRLHHLLPHVEEPRTKDQEYTDEWVKYDRHVMDVLLASVTESVMPKIAGTQSAKEIWNTLAVDFAAASRGLREEEHPSNDSIQRAPASQKIQGRWRRSLRYYGSKCNGFSYLKRLVSPKKSHSPRNLPSQRTGQQLLIGDGTGDALDTISGGSLPDTRPT